MVLPLFLPIGKSSLAKLPQMHSVGAMQQLDCSAMANEHGAAAILKSVFGTKANLLRPSPFRMQGDER
jgi:hypothetical protein